MTLISKGQLASRVKHPDNKREEIKTLHVARISTFVVAVLSTLIAVWMQARF